MQVHCSEGLATHTGPESCAHVREGMGEALTGERIGQPLSGENSVWGADALEKAEGNMGWHASASAGSTPRRLRPWHVRKAPAREPGDLRHRPPLWAGRIGKAEMPKPMTHGAQKSDPLIVPTKPANKAGQPAAESVEGSGGIERNAELQSTVRTQSRAAVDQAQARIREAVNRNSGEKLTALLHHVTVDSLRWAFLQLRKDAAAGVDGTTWEGYAQGLEARLTDLHRRVHTGAYRAQPSRRVYIPKSDGRQRPLGIAALEDKIVQQAVVVILTPIYEAEFLGFSYGFRPGRSQHDALDALAFGIKAKKVCWILDADISRFLDASS